MISENSFFKKLPEGMNLEQRLILEGIGWAIQMLSLSYDKLKAAASQVDVTSDTYPTSQATEMFACCWSIVDQCHMLRNLLERMNPATDGLIATFIEKFEAATLIRNAMDHLHQKISNIAKKKDPMPPLFGALCFAVISNEDISDSGTGLVVIKGGTLVVLTAGALTHPTHKFQFDSPPGRVTEIPLGMFQFTAFEHCIDVSQMMIDLAALVAHFETVVKSNQEQQLREFARKNNLEEDKVLCGEHNVAMMITMPMPINKGDASRKN
jgi:hypothetical protein